MDTGGLGSLLWLLVVGALFYFMMRRGGCGGPAHEGHERHREGPKGHEGHRGGEGVTSGLKDPVCGMAVEAARAKTSVYRGQTYSFCSSACRERFETDPASYARESGSGCC